MVSDGQLWADTTTASRNLRRPEFPYEDTKMFGPYPNYLSSSIHYFNFPYLTVQDRDERFKQPRIYPWDIEITSWKMRAYDFYSRVE